MVVEYKCNKCKGYWKEKFKSNNQCPYCKSDDFKEIRRRIKMPAKYFIDGENKYLIEDVLNEKTRMPGYPLAYLQMIGKDRSWEGNLHVTDLYNGLRETFLKYCTFFSVNPDDQAFAVAGTLKHNVMEHADAGIKEMKIAYRNIIGALDVLEFVKGRGYVLTDYKNQGAFAVRKFMGWSKKPVPVLDDYGVQVYLKSGKNKGQPKYKNEWFLDPANAETEQYDFQLNLYRKALEESLEITIAEMRIFFMLRDGGLAATREQGLNHNTYLLPVKSLTDEVIDKYIDERSVVAPMIIEFLERNGGPTEDNAKALAAFAPMECSPKERWYDPATGINRKCESYCPVRDICKKIGG